MMMWIALAATLAYATPVPPTAAPGRAPSYNHIRHLAAALPSGGRARINEQGNNIPCWDSPASLTAFGRAYSAANQAAVEMQVANDSFFLEEGTRVQSLSTQGMLGQITHLKILDGDHAGATCYIQSSLKIYSDIKLPKAAKRH